MPTRYKSKRGIRWRGVVKMDGRVVETRLFGTGPAAKREAAQWELDTRKEMEKQAPTPSDSPSVLDWANKYLAYSEQKHSKKTFKEKISTFKFFLPHTRENDLLNISPALAMGYLQAQCKARSGYAANKEKKNLAAAWSWGEKYIKDFPQMANPFLGIERFKEERSPRYVPDEKDFWKRDNISTPPNDFNRLQRHNSIKNAQKTPSSTQGSTQGRGGHSTPPAHSRTASTCAL